MFGRQPPNPQGEEYNQRGTGRSREHNRGGHQGHSGYPHGNRASDHPQMPAAIQQGAMGRGGYQGHMESAHGYGDGTSDNRQHGQVLATKQMFRSLQASKQMVFEMYENVISNLEEMEAREEAHARRRGLPRSDVDLPDQRRFKDSDVKARLETQLLLFETQLNGCPKEIKEKARAEMIERLFRWSAMRAKEHVPLNTSTDLYATQLFEVLHKGRTQHPQAFYNPPEISEEGLDEFVPNMARGQHKLKELDEGFKSDDKKEAKLRPIRDGGNVVDGIQRMLAVNQGRQDLQQDLDQYFAEHAQMDLC